MTPDELKEYKASENERRSRLCKEQKAKMTTEELETYLLKDSTRMTAKNKENQSPSPDIIKFSTPYRARQTYGKAVKRVMKALPTSPRKRIAVVKGLAEKVGMNNDDKIDEYMHPNSVHEEVHTKVKDFYFRTDISYTAPGMVDVMTIWGDG